MLGASRDLSWANRQRNRCFVRTGVHLWPGNACMQMLPGVSRRFDRSRQAGIRGPVPPGPYVAHRCDLGPVSAGQQWV